MEKLQQLLEESDKVVQASKKTLVDMACQQLKGAAREAAPWAGGPNGRDWTDGLADGASWSELLLVAEKTILAHPGEKWDGLKKTLQQVEPHFRPCNMHQKGSGSEGS